MATPLNRRLALLGLALPALALGACASTTSNSFKGEKHEVAQAISNLQGDAKSADEQKICTNDLAGPLVARLNRAKGGCKEAIKHRLTDIDSYDITIHAIQLSGAGARPTASAAVTSVYSGKKRPSTLLLVKEGGKWRLSGVQ